MAMKRGNGARSPAIDHPHQSLGARELNASSGSAPTSPVLLEGALTLADAVELRIRPQGVEQLAFLAACGDADRRSASTYGSAPRRSARYPTRGAPMATSGERPMAIDGIACRLPHREPLIGGRLRRDMRVP